MSMSLEQFNKIAMKEDLEELRKEMMTKEDKKEIMDAIDKFTKTADTSKKEKAANLGAHNRIQEDVNEVRKHVGLKIKHPVMGL
jgi:predicted  nucleic acid-binding Zn-ribbon protein